MIGSVLAAKNEASSVLMELKMGMRLTHRGKPLVSCPDPSGGGVWVWDYYLAIYPRVAWVASCSLKNPKVTSWLVTFVLYLVATRWLASSSAASVSPSLSVTGEHSTSPSRSVRSPVWSFFTYDAATEKSICQVELSDHVICVHNISGKYPTNLKQHLKRSHPEAQYYRLNCQLRKPKMRRRQGDAPVPTRQLLRLVNN